MRRVPVAIAVAVALATFPVTTRSDPAPMTLEAANSIEPSDFPDGTPRQFASAVGHGDVDRALSLADTLPHGVNTIGTNGITALELAVLNDRPDMVRALLHAGANPNGTSGRAPLYIAIEHNKPDLFAMLLNAKADPNGNWNDGANLDAAALYGRDAMILRLLDAGARINQQDEIGSTAILSAADADHWQTVLLLLDHGASPWLPLTNGTTLPLAAFQSRILPNNLDGKALLTVIERLRAAGCPWPPPSIRDVRRLVAEHAWPPPGVHHDLRQ